MHIMESIFYGFIQWFQIYDFILFHYHGPRLLCMLGNWFSLSFVLCDSQHDWHFKALIVQHTWYKYSFDLLIPYQHVDMSGSWTYGSWQHASISPVFTCQCLFSLEVIARYRMMLLVIYHHYIGCTGGNMGNKLYQYPDSDHAVCYKDWSAVVWLRLQSFCFARSTQTAVSEIGS